VTLGKPSVPYTTSTSVLIKQSNTQATVAEPGLRCKGVVVGFGLSAVFWPQ